MGIFGAKKKDLVSVRLKVAGFVDGRMLTADFSLQAPAGSSVKELIALADKSGQLPKRALKKIFSLPRPPTVLLNGEGLDVPADLGRAVNAGDEVAVMTPLGGG
jgi:molybdopterin converting factor small subunit